MAWKSHINIHLKCFSVELAKHLPLRAVQGFADSKLLLYGT